MDLGKQVENAIREGQRVQQQVQEITLKALTERQLDFEGMRKVTREAFDAVRNAASTQETGMREAAKQAVRGVEAALAKATEALKLSLEEAGGRLDRFSKEDLAKARADLGEVEKMFVQTLKDTAKAAQGAARVSLEELARHAEASGTAVGRQLRETAVHTDALAGAARAQFKAGVDAAATGGALFARAAAGVLAAFADAIEPKKKQ